MTKKKLIYIIENKKLDITKIGITDNIQRRLRQLECASGIKLNLFYTTELIQRAKLVETSLHTHFKKYRVEGEYFKLPADVILEKLLFVMNNLSKVYIDL